MITVLAEVSVQDYQQFISVFATRGLAKRRQHGCRGAQVFQTEGDGRRLVIVFDWESREAFQAFLDDPDVKTTMRSSGTLEPPTFTVMQRWAAFPA